MPPGQDDAVLRLKPLQYVHVLDNNRNVTRVEVGPQTLTRQEPERLVAGPVEMVSIPPRCFVKIGNPHVRDASDEPMMDEYSQVKLRHGEHEIRFAQEPFVLYPGEGLVSEVTPLTVVPANSALRLRATRDHEREGTTVYAGDELLCEGCATYYPRIEEEVIETITAQVVKPNQALRLRARKACTDRDGVARKAGEEWLVRAVGAYLPRVDEVVLGLVSAYILTEVSALHLRATRTFVDTFGAERKAGEEWLVQSGQCEAVIPGVYEEVVGLVDIVTLSNRQYCVVCDPIGSDGKPQLGRRELRKGPASFFLQPGESLEHGCSQAVPVLGEDEALLLRACEAYVDVVNGEEVKRAPGDRWMVAGPCDYIPAVQVEIVEKRRSIPLDANEGVYVRDIQTGKVRAVKGQSYMLKSNEELWEKELPKAVEELLAREAQADAAVLRTAAGAESAPKLAKRKDKWRMVSYHAPHNSAVQIYDYKEKRARVVFGPDLVLLGPDEHFTVLSLSGGKPKKTNAFSALALLLGPDFMTDLITVETSDHARLKLQLSYNWAFEIDTTSAADAAAIFSVPDFVGDCCKAVASRVRGAVAQVGFDSFHKNSADVIRSAVFGKNEKLYFEANRLVISSIDIQAVEPVDSKTRESLQKSVQLAIGITTQSQEAEARHDAERTEQEARGRLERQKIQDEANAEKARRELLQLQVESAAIESTGTAKAEAQARSEAAAIEGTAAVEQARLRAKAMAVESESELSLMRRAQGAEVAHQKALDELELSRTKRLAEIEAKKFSETVAAIGTDTLASIASAGPDLQAKLLSGLGIQSMLITDGNSPINLFNAANGLIGTKPQ